MQKEAFPGKPGILGGVAASSEAGGWLLKKGARGFLRSPCEGVNLRCSTPCRQDPLCQSLPDKEDPFRPKGVWQKSLTKKVTEAPDFRGTRSDWTKESPKTMETKWIELPFAVPPFAAPSRTSCQRKEEMPENNRCFEAI